MDLAALALILTTLVPINGIILLGIISKTKKNRQLLLQLWRFRNMRNK